MRPLLRACPQRWSPSEWRQLFLVQSRSEISTAACTLLYSIRLHFRWLSLRRTGRISRSHVPVCIACRFRIESHPRFTAGTVSKGDRSGRARRGARRYPRGEEEAQGSSRPKGAAGAAQAHGNHGSISDGAFHGACSMRTPRDDTGEAPFGTEFPIASPRLDACCRRPSAIVSRATKKAFFTDGSQGLKV